MESLEEKEAQRYPNMTQGASGKKGEFSSTEREVGGKTRRIRWKKNRTNQSLS
jgi:hypothetical protein